MNQRAQRGALAIFEILDCIEGDSRSLSQLPLVKVESKPKGAKLPAEVGFPFVKCSHIAIIYLFKYIINVFLF